MNCHEAVVVFPGLSVHLALDDSWIVKPAVFIRIEGFHSHRVLIKGKISFVLYRLPLPKVIVNEILGGRF
jgi:hypothetical protein